MASGLGLPRFQDRRLPIAARLLLGPDPCSDDQVYPGPAPCMIPRRLPPRSQLALLCQRSLRLRSPARQGLLIFPHLPNNRCINCRNPSSSLITTYPSVPASSTTPTSIGRANNVSRSSSPPPSGFLHWVHLHRRRTTSSTTSPGSVAHCLRIFLPSPLKVGYIQPTRTPFVSPVDQTKLYRNKHGRPRPCSLPHPPRAHGSILMHQWALHTSHSPTGCHSGASRTLGMLMRFYWWMGHERLYPMEAPPLPQGPGPQDFALNHSLAYLFLVVSKRPLRSRQRPLLRPSTHHASGQRLRPLFHRPFQPPRRRVRHYHS